MFNCINIIKISIKNNKKGFIINNNNKNLTIVKEFIKINIIKYIILKDDVIIGYINYKNGKSVFNNIENMFKPSNKKYISLKNLKKVSTKHNWVFILSTNKGIINSYDAIKLNVGGLLIAQIWN